MGTYIPGTGQEQQEMLAACGYSSFEEMFSCIPEEVRLKAPLNLPSGRSELETDRIVRGLAARNVIYPTLLRGAGAYRHYIPAIVRSITSKEEFVTAYTPYQAEISQGILQSIFEYQTMICELTGMDVANASHYDGATAAAEALAMCRDRKRTRAYVSAAIHPGVLEVLKTYCFGSGMELTVVAAEDGATDLKALGTAMEDPEAACFYFQQPNFFGRLEDAEAIEKTVHEAGAKLIMGVNPMSLAVLKAPGELGADICVGDGQPLGLPLSFGGPYLGFMAVKKRDMRKLPGRIVGETTDAAGRRAFVLTLQAREQHIRREKASSNICSNQALCALTVSAYLAAMGTAGLRTAAKQCYDKAHYLQKKLEEAGLEPVHGGPFFHEFVTACPCGADRLLDALAKEGILGGYPLSEKELLWCATELNTKEEMDLAAETAAKILAGEEVPV